jgi:methionine-rich copper-binding protein CopC/putative copper export protein
MRQRRPLRLGLLVLISLTTLFIALWSTTVFQQTVVFAHAFVIGSVPVDGSTVTNAPTVVRIFFNAPISPASFATVYTPNEQIVNASHSTSASNNPRYLDTPLLNPTQLPQGSYTVRWTAIANDDGHTTHGVIGFNVGQSSSGLSGQTILGPSTSNILPSLDLIGILAVAWEWLVLVALTFWIGTLIIEGLLIYDVERIAILHIQSRKRSHPLQWLCLLALLVGECITLILRASQLSQVVNGGGIDLRTLGQILTQTFYGYLWFIRIGLILCSLGFLWWTIQREQSPQRITRTALRGRKNNRFGQRRQRVTQEYTLEKEAEPGAETTPLPVIPRYYTGVWLLLASLILVTYALTSDAAQLATPVPHLSTIVLMWLNLAARCIWLGGLAYLGYILLPLLTGIEPERHADVLIALLQRFRPVTLGSIGVFLVSGFYLTEVSISNPQQFITYPYGRTLLVAAILVVIMLLLTGYALFVLRPKLARQAALLPVVNAELPARRTRQTALDSTVSSLKRSLTLQSWLGAAVLLCAALMTFFAPPIVFPNLLYTQSTATLPSASNTTSQSQTQKVGNLTVTLQVLPGRVDYANTVIVTMNDANGNPVTNAQVQLHTNMELMNMGTAQATVKGGSPTYIATFDKDAAFSMFGRWDIALTIQRPGQPTLQTTFTVTLSG